MIMLVDYTKKDSNLEKNPRNPILGYIRNSVE